MLIRRRRAPEPRVVRDRREQLAAARDELRDRSRDRSTRSRSRRSPCGRRVEHDRLGALPRSRSRPATSGPTKNSSFFNGTYSPNGTSRILRYVAVRSAVDADEDRGVVDSDRAAPFVPYSYSSVPIDERRARLRGQPAHRLGQRALGIEVERRRRLGPDHERRAAANRLPAQLEVAREDRVADSRIPLFEPARRCPARVRRAVTVPGARERARREPQRAPNATATSSTPTAIAPIVVDRRRLNASAAAAADTSDDERGQAVHAGHARQLHDRQHRRLRRAEQHPRKSAEGTAANPLASRPRTPAPARRRSCQNAEPPDRTARRTGRRRSRDTPTSARRRATRPIRRSRRRWPSCRRPNTACRRSRRTREDAASERAGARRLRPDVTLSATPTMSGARAIHANAGCPNFGKLAASSTPERSASA